MKKVNQLVICKDEYKNREEFENAIKDAIIVLLNNNYIMTVKYDDKELGIVVIEYDYAELDIGAPHPIWLYPEEEESIVYRNEG